MTRLSVNDHRRDSAGLTYVYPVLSRRSGGLSIGINLNPNNACNWHCIYCQVPDLHRGAGPEIDLFLLEDELRGLLEEALSGAFFDRFEVPAAQRVIRDLAISGNGEPTSCPQFDQVIGVIGQLCAEFELFERVKRVLITNGSLMGRPEVERGIAHWAELGGEIWFKLDRATREGMRQINDVQLSPEQVRRNLERAARLCPTWIQTCVFALDGAPPSDDEQAAYRDFLACCLEDEIPLAGVLLYGLARPSLQPGAARLSALPVAWLEAFAASIRALGVTVSVHS